MPKAGEAERQVAPALVHALLQYVRRVAGRDITAKVLAGSGLTADEVRDKDRWFSSAEAVALAETAARLCHDGGIGMRAGEELWSMLSSSQEYVDLVRAEGNVATALVASARRGSKMSTGHWVEVVESGDDHAVLTGRFRSRADAHPYYCGMTGGFYSQIPRAFGMLGNAVELQCQGDGAAECRFQIVWQPDPSRQTPDESTLSESRSRRQRLLDQLEQVHQLSSQLLSAERIDAVLAAITTEAGHAVQAPRYLLAVKVSDRDQLRVHHRGFRAGTENAFADRLLGGSLGEADGVLAADVEHDGRQFGRLAACFARGSSFGELDRRLLAAYARHAAAVLSHVAALEHAGTDRDTARALLDLARSIAGANTVAEVGRRLALTVPRVADSDTGSLWLWDAEQEALVLAAHSDYDPLDDYPGPRRLTAHEQSAVRELVAELTPQLLDATGAPAALRTVFDQTDLRHIAVAPITSHGEFVGVVAAGYRWTPPETHVLFPRLTGLADQAAVAMQNVQLVEQISQQAMHDPLTGLANRKKLQTDAETAIARARAAGTGVALLFIDLDRFKDVNDTLGHAAGDELIRQVATRIGAVTRPADTVARLGGDEFLVVLADVSEPEVAQATARRMVAAVREAFPLDGREVFISCSVGIACYPEGGEDYATLLKHADHAMYDAKSAGSDGIATHRPRSRHRTTRHLEIESQLHGAIANGEIEVFYQPQFAVSDGALVAAEALVRWRHPEQGLLSPASFIDAAAKSGLITDLDAYVRASALRQLRAWHDLGAQLLLALNVCARDVQAGGLAQRLITDTAAAGVSPEFVEIELTERSTSDEQVLGALVAEIRGAGFRVAIDDFGTGTSTLQRLEMLPIHTLKIDRGFLRVIDDHKHEPVVIDAIARMAHRLGLTTVMEGIETADQLAVVRACGVDLAQGFLLSPPIPAARLTAMLDAVQEERSQLLPLPA